MRLHLRYHRQGELLRQPITPFALEIEALEQYRRRTAQRDDIASDSFQILGDLFDPFEGVLERLAIAAAEADEGRHDLDPVRSAFVPKVKTLASVRRFDQTDPRAPRIHPQTPSQLHLSHRAGDVQSSHGDHARGPPRCAAGGALPIVCGGGGSNMSFTLWRGVVGMVRPTRRPGTLEELIRILPEGIGIVPLLLNFKAGSNTEFLNSIPQYERFAMELAEQGVDVIMLTGAPPFMLLGPEKEAALTESWTKKFKTPVITDPQMQVAALRAMKIKKFIGASYSALQNKIVLDYMTAAGFRALSMEPIDVPFDQVAQISVEMLYAHVKSLYRQHRDADGVYIQGGGWQTVRVIELLEKDLGIPVVHATICQAWQIHKQLDVRETKPGYGRLLTELP